MKNSINRPKILKTFNQVDFLFDLSKSYINIIRPTKIEYNIEMFSAGPFIEQDYENICYDYNLDIINLNGLCLPVRPEITFGKKYDDVRLEVTTALAVEDLKNSHKVKMTKTYLITILYPKDFYLDLEEIELIKYCCLKWLEL